MTRATRRILAEQQKKQTGEPVVNQLAPIIVSLAPALVVAGKDIP